MDGSSLGFILLVVLVSALVAVVADNVGRKLGKKRLHYKKLRPKHVAMIGTALVGMLISVVSMGILFAVSADVRTWLIEGRAAIDRARKLQVQVNTLQTDAKELETQNQEKTQQARDLDRKLQQQQRQIETFQRTLTQAEQQYEKAQARVAALTKTVREGTTRIAKIQEQLNQGRVALSRIRTENDRLLATGREASRQLSETYQRNLMLEKTNTDLGKLIESVNSQLRTLDQNRSNLEASIKSATEELDASRNELAQATQELNTTNQQLSAARVLLDRQQEQLRIFGPNVQISRNNPITFQAGEELARIQLEPNLSRGEAEAAFNRLMNIAISRAVSRGLTNGSVSGSGSSGVALFPLTESPSGPPLSQPALRERYINGMTLQPEPLAILARTEWNHFRGEDVLVRLEPFRNPVVYNRDQPIADTRVDGRRPEQEILEQINQFLAENVRERATEDRMIPVAGVEDQFGMISSEVVLDTVRRIRQENRVVRLTAVTRSVIRAADPLDLYFRIR